MRQMQRDEDLHVPIARGCIKRGQLLIQNRKDDTTVLRAWDAIPKSHCMSLTSKIRRLRSIQGYRTAHGDTWLVIYALKYAHYAQYLGAIRRA